MSSTELKNQQLLHYALVKAREHDSGGAVRIWAVVTDKRYQIVAEAGNDYFHSHPLQKHFMIKSGRYKNEKYKYEPYHAEIKVLSILQSMRLTGTKLFIARASREMEARIAKPCAACQAAINELGKSLGIKEVYYTVSA